MQSKPVTLTAADRQRVEREAAAIVQKALLHIKVYYPFYGALAERLKVKQDWRHPTMYTDAVVLGYSPAFVAMKSWAYILFVHAHEVTHCALGHPFRRKDRDPKDWNVAIDHVTNLALLKDPEFAKLWASDPELSSEGLADARFLGMAAEQVYTIVHGERLQKEAEKREKERQRQEQQKQEQQPQPPSASEPGDEEGEGEESSPQPSEKPGDDAEGEGEEESLGESMTGAAGDCLDAGASGEQPEPDEEEGDEDEEGENDAETEGESEGASDDRDGEEESEESDDEGTDESNDSAQPGDEVEPHQGGMDESQVAKLEREWSQAVMTAQLAAGGDIESSMARAIGATQESPRSFKDCVDDFAHATCAMEDSWSRPNRRYSDTYLPSRCALGVKVMVLGVDTSGSISEVALGLMQRAAQGVLDDFGIKSMQVVYCDSRIRGTREFLPGDQVTFEDAKGGGGTLFHPVLRYALELEQAGEEVAGIIYLTDLEGAVFDPEDFAHFEILWVDIVANRQRWNPAEAPAGLGKVISVYQ